MSYNALPYGTYSKVNYQTVDFTIFNRNALLLIKALSILTIVVASVILLSYALIIIVPFITAIIMTTQFGLTIVLISLFALTFPKGSVNARYATA